MKAGRNLSWHYKGRQLFRYCTDTGNWKKTNHRLYVKDSHVLAGSMNNINIIHKPPMHFCIQENTQAMSITAETRKSSKNRNIQEQHI
jgi:hypothetical protein